MLDDFDAAKLTGGVAAIAAAIYGIKRRLSADTSADKLDGKAEQLITKLETQLQRERDHSQHLGEVIERVATERNEAVQQVGRMEGTIQALERELNRVGCELVKLESRNTQLANQVEQLTAAISDMNTRLDAVNAINADLIAMIQRNEAARQPV